MFTCPVCTNKSESLVCPECHFDGSMDFEHYPTLQKLKTSPEAISSLRAKRGAKPSAEEALEALRKLGWDEATLSAVGKTLKSDPQPATPPIRNTPPPEPAKQEPTPVSRPKENDIIAKKAYQSSYPIFIRVFIWIALIAFLVVSGFTFIVTDSGNLGDNLEWKLYLNGRLTITGDGDSYPSGIFETFEDYPVRSVEIHYGMRNIPDNIFWGQNKLKAVRLPNSIKSIDDCSFAFCTSLKEITLPNSVQEIGGYAFQGCENLTVTILNGGCHFQADSFSSDTVIIAPAGSQVERLALAYGLTFKPL